eukprot:1425528-Rhodomonas_salina.1
MRRQEGEGRSGEGRRGRRLHVSQPDALRMCSAVSPVAGSTIRAMSVPDIPYCARRQIAEPQYRCRWAGSVICASSVPGFAYERRRQIAEITESNVTSPASTRRKNSESEPGTTAY